MRCQECGTAKARYEDPGDHTWVSDGQDLCAGCFRNAAEDRITELEEEIAALQEMVSNIGKRKKTKK